MTQFNAQRKTLFARIAQLEGRDLILLFQSTALILMIRLAYWITSFQGLHRLLKRLSAGVQPINIEDDSAVQQTIQAIDRASRYTPGGNHCLTRALAASVLLKRQGHSGLLRIGVVRRKDGNITAHAWLESQGKIVIGNMRGISGFTPLPQLENEE